jgi:Fic family protein
VRAVKERTVEIEEKNEALKELLGARKLQLQAQEFLEKFEMSWVYHDNALEGVVYTPAELMAALRPGAVAAEASLMPIVLEIRNHKSALEYVREEAKNASKKAPALTMNQVKRIHDLLSGNTPEAMAARAAAERRERSEKELAKEREKSGYRKDMPLHRTYFHEIAQPSKIPGLLEKLIENTGNTEFKEMHPINQAASIQHGIIQIFPFTEHSGKVARMASNMVLLRHGFFPAVIHSIDRQRYYEAFRGTVAAFRSTLMDAMENALDNGLKYFRDLNRKYKAIN